MWKASVKFHNDVQSSERLGEKIGGKDDCEAKVTCNVFVYIYIYECIWK